MRKLADELRHQYTLYYSRVDKTRDGRFRRVHVETRDKSLSASSRIGYLRPANSSDGFGPLCLA